MFDVRKILIIFLVGVLYAIFSYSLIDAIYPGPEYEDYCGRGLDKVMPVSIPPTCTPAATNVKCEPVVLECESDATPRYDYNASGCPMNVTCDYCQRDYNNAQDQYNLTFFIFASILGLIALGIGLLMPMKQDISEWIATGFLLGGLITIFIGTAIYYGDMARIARPIIIFIELALVIFLAYRQFKKK